MIHDAVKLRYYGLGVITDTRLIQTFFLVPAESLLISMCNHMVRKDSFSTDFHSLQTSFPVPTLRTCSIDSRLADSHVVRMAVVES